MAGGSGTRLWPASWSGQAKQYLPVNGDETLIDLAIQRALAIIKNQKDGRLIIVAAASHIEDLQRTIFNIPPESRGKLILIAEPQARNTAPALALATAFIQRTRGNKATAIVLTSDHLISPMEEFLQNVAQAYRLAKEGWLSIFGIPPSYPATGFGYIECGSEIPEHLPARKVLAFVEKPELKRAKLFLSEKNRQNYFWNSGMFCFSIDTIHRAYEALAGDILAHFMALPRPETKKNADGYVYIQNWPGLADAFKAVRPISFDHAIAEHFEKKAVVPVSFTWTDIGSWDDWAALHTQTAAERANLFVHDNSGTAYNSANCFVDSDIPVALCEVEDLIVVIRSDTPNGRPRALVCRKGKSQSVKDLVEKLRAEGREDLL